VSSFRIRQQMLVLREPRSWGLLQDDGGDLCGGRKGFPPLSLAGAKGVH